MKTSRFICCCAIVVIVSTAVGSTFADQSTKERIRIHKEWLARRAASRVNTNSTQRTTYLRKLIKFKNEHEPLSENDISFVPHFAHNNRDNEYHQEGGGGSGGTEGTRGDTVESRGELQQDSDNEYGLRPVGSVANPDDMSEQQSQADRYRYNVATGESNLPRPADGSVQSRLLVHHPEDGPEASNEIPLVTSTGGSSGASGVTQQRNDATVTSGGRGNESETPTERINAVAKINEPGRSGTVHGMNNDLQPLQVGATGSGTHKSDPGRAVVGDKRKSWHHSTIINNETTDDENSTSSYGGRAGFATTTGATPTTTAISKVALEGAKVDDHDRTKVDGNVTVRNGFGPWSNWTACSRSCGGGVKSQQRKCWRREYINGKKSPKPAVESHDCIGIVKRYHLCNEQDCPDPTVDFREQQCTSFNNQTFQDKRYIWEAFIKDDAECELNCKPIGMRYFATLNKTVIDGTPCRKPTEYFRRNNSGRGICVDGICKAVHNSGVISGTFMNNGAVRCGTSVCRPVSAIYTKSQQTNGYVLVATIPAGVHNITVTELQNSQNYLALKTVEHQRFIINGDYTISLSGFYQGAGTTFEYRRVDSLNNGSVSSFRKIEGVTEWITSPGPTTEAIELYVLSQQPNPGIKYEYLMPINTNPILDSGEDNRVDGLTNDITEKASFRVPKQRIILNNTLPSSTTKPLRKRKFLWKVIGFGACSKSCGGGVQQPVIKCVREAPTRVFSPKRCAHLAQPVLNDHLLRCNTQPCPAYWKLSEWSECNCEDVTTDDEAYKTREVKCVQELISGIVIQVNSGACMEEQPPASEKCECVKHPKSPAKVRKPPTVVNHHHHHHNGNNHHNGHNTQNDMQITNGYGRTSLDSSRISQQVESKKTGIWLTADWSQRCSATCGVGLQTRSIFCDRSSSTNSERCDLRFTPDTTRECTSNRACEFGEWFAGPWGLCSGDCFNLTRSRTVLCIRNDNFATDSECDDSERPISIENCDVEAIDDCKPRWHYSEWSECTKTCDGGNQRRVVKCLEFNQRDKIMQESASCRYADRPMAYRVCNEEPCPSTSTSSTTEASSMEPYVEPRVDMIQNDGSCRDVFPNCSLVIKAKLCSYAYYSQACCQTCRNRSNELY